jgi:tRNA(fMet)-specific endonuclease VapC
VRGRLQRELAAGGEVLVSTIVTFELWYGVAKSTRQEANALRLATFLAAPIELAPFDDEDARFAGRVRADLELAGTPIRAYDVLIAGQAVRLGAMLVDRQQPRVRPRARPRMGGLDDFSRSLTESGASGTPSL